MREGYDGVVSRPPHLPPEEHTLLLKRDAKGKVKATEKLTVPLDNYGVPNPDAYLKLLLSTIDASHTWPESHNVHHLAYPRRDFHRFGPHSIEYRYRESASLMMRKPVQLHNYGHEVTLPPPIPAYEIMQARVREQDQINTLFELGRNAIRAEKWSLDMHRHGTVMYRNALMYNNKQEHSAQKFFDYLEQCDDATVGLMPDREHLYRIGYHEATRQLGTLAAARSLDYRRDARSTELMFS